MDLFSFRNTPLLLAAYQCHNECVTTLLEKGTEMQGAVVDNDGILSYEDSADEGHVTGEVGEKMYQSPN